jgi:hypothetical protein
MEMLNYSLTKNKSITELIMTESNYLGPFGFFSNSNLKYFKFREMYHKTALAFARDFKLNSDLISLNVSFDFSEEMVHYVDLVRGIIETLSNHKNLESLTLENSYIWTLKYEIKYKITERKIDHEFQSLLNIPSLRSLNLTRCIKSKENFKKFLLELNQNETLTNLVIDFKWNDPNVDLNFEINNNSIEFLDFAGNHESKARIDFTNNFQLLKSIFKIPTLRSLTLSGNELGNIGMEYVCSMLSENHKIQHITINGNSISLISKRIVF